MILRFALVIAVTAAVIGVSPPQPSWAQSPAPPAGAAKPGAKPDIKPTPAAVPQSTDAFGEDTSLTAKPIVFVKGTSSWDDALGTITGALKKIKGYADKEGLKSDGPAMTIFTAADDKGFDFQVAVPVAAPPKDPPHGDVAVGTSPQGHALKFVYRGSYDELETFYETVTNYLDDKKIELPNSYIEEYSTDLLSTDPEKLVVNVLIPTK
jgi:effector-binding domain-containing protein